MDGSLIMMFFVNGERLFSTKGSFVSEKAIKAKQIFEAICIVGTQRLERRKVFMILDLDGQAVCIHGQHYRI